MDFDVKNTTLCGFWEIICPHYCVMCGKLGKILCNECKNHNISENVNKCLKCGVVVNSRCGKCKVNYDASWMVGQRDDGLGELVDKFKYESVRALAKPLAEMLASALPCLPENVVVVPVPTIRKHVRERGLDHTWLLAKRLAKLRGWRCERLVGRATNSVQVGANMELRKKQAKNAYKLIGAVDEKKSYLVVDDVCTTGASLDAVCGLLKKNGAQKVMVAVVAKAGD